MNKLLRGVFIYLVIAVIMSLVIVSSIHSEVLTNGKIFAYEVLSPQELKVFYETVNDYVDLRINVESITYNEAMSTNIEVFNASKNQQVIEVVGLFDEKNQWSLGSNKDIDLTQAKNFFSRNENPISRVLLPPLAYDQFTIIKFKTVDLKDIFVVFKQSPATRKIFNKYSTTVYKIQWTAITLAVLVSFLPILINILINYYLPLRKLKIAANSIAEGDLDFNIESQGLGEIKNLSHAFEHMRQELEYSRKRESLLENDRKLLITNISHDLRTPITSIQGYVEGLLDGKGENPERMERYLKTIYLKTDYLNTMINDLFEFSQLELGEYTLNTQIWSSKEIMPSILEPVSLWLEDAGWDVDLISPFPIAVLRLDQTRLIQIVENIVQNSIKYAGNGTHMKIQAYIENHSYNISFKDNGVGISEEALPYVFEAFYREDKSRRQSFGGSGLGLAICKKLMELHGGKIIINSTINEGTELILSFPLST